MVSNKRKYHSNDACFVLIRPKAPYILRAEDIEYRNEIRSYIDYKIGA